MIPTKDRAKSFEVRTAPRAPGRTVALRRPGAALLALVLAALTGCVHGPARQRSEVESIPGLVAFWTFGEEPGCPRLSTGTTEAHPLQEVGGPIARVPGGPFSGYAAELNGRQYFRIPYAETGDLNISGPDAQVSLFAEMRQLHQAARLERLPR